MRVVKFKLRFSQLNENQKIEIICNAQKFAEIRYWKLIEIYTIIEEANPVLYYQYLGKINFDLIYSTETIETLFFLNAKRLYYTAAGGQSANVEVINESEILPDYELLFDNHNQNGNYKILFSELSFIQKIIALDSLRTHVHYRAWAHYSNDNLIRLFTFYNERKDVLEIKPEDFSIVINPLIEKELDQIFWY